MQSLQEWDYGEYEGLTRDQVIELRLNQGLSNARDWNIFRDGCADGEYAEPRRDFIPLSNLILDLQIVFYQDFNTSFRQLKMRL